jgi:hypothetical protein
MESIATTKYARIAICLLTVAALWGCGPGDDKGKTEKKAEPAPPKAAPAPAPKKEAPKAEVPGPEWKVLGRRNADMNTDKDVIRVGGKEGKFKQLRLGVDGASVAVDRITVTFPNGKQANLNFKQELKGGSLSKAIDLPGDDRAIKEVELLFRTTGTGDKKASITLYGR